MERFSQQTFAKMGDTKKCFCICFYFCQFFSEKSNFFLTKIVTETNKGEQTMTEALWHLGCSRATVTLYKEQGPIL